MREAGSRLNDNLRIFDKAQEHDDADFTWRADRAVRLGQQKVHNDIQEKH